MGAEHLVISARARKGFLVVLALVGLVIFALAPQVFLLAMTCVLFGVFLVMLCELVERFTGLERKWSLTIVTTLLLAISALLGWWLAPQIGEQFSLLAEKLPRAVATLRDRVAETNLGRELLSRMPAIEGTTASGGTLSKASFFVSSALGILVYLFVTVFVGLYLAANPCLYIDLFAKLFPKTKRDRFREIVIEAGRVLKHWLAGRLILMGSNGVVTAIGLLIMGVPLPITLGIVSALLNFIPNFGPVIAAIPAVLIAFLEGPLKALAVAVFYFAYQMFDGYVLTPLVQRRTVSLPPALTILSQVLFGVLFGTMGVLVAVPLAAVSMVFFREVYQHDVVRDE